jgi:hypothetical protein
MNQPNPLTPHPGDYIEYYGRHNNIVAGFIAERSISPLTGNPRYRVVDSMQEAKDVDAGRWIGVEDTHAVYESVPKDQAAEAHKPGGIRETLHEMFG